MMLDASVIVTTYNKPKELELVLCGLNLQEIKPLEILIADDGSNIETKNLISKWSDASKTPIKHIWHEDKGNRKLKICNRAVKESSGNYLIFLDGDSIPHHLWVNDHISAARKNMVLCGRRVRLGPKITESIDLPYVQARKLENIFGSTLASALSKDTKRYMHGIRLPKLLARCFHITERRLMGVNFSLHKELFEKLGGYVDSSDKIIASKERRREDARLEIELLRAGAVRYPLINQGIVYHLYHKERPPNEEIDNFIQDNYKSALQHRKSISKNIS
jgi:glycosyltransferase involved in cell wall biosynthesis